MSFASDQNSDAWASDGASERVLDLLPDPVLVWRSDPPALAEIRYANRAAREQLHIPSAGATLEAAIRNPRVLEAVDEVLTRRQPREVAFESIDAPPRFWRAHIAPVVSAEGSGELLLMLRDETDARRTERMRADFLANASHELRTPLASLAGFIDTLRTHARDDPAAREQFLGIMAEQAWRMRRLIDDLLSLSRIEMNEHVSPSGLVSMARTVRDVVDASSPPLKDRATTVTVEAAGGLPPVTGDRDQLVQVVQNLLDNALKYSPADGAVRLTVEAAPSQEEALAPSRQGAAHFPLVTPSHSGAGTYVVLRVSDDGAGMSRRDLPRLTERFYRAEGQTVAGTGLGLAIVKHVVNRHRGGLTVESAEGAGTTFSVYLPAASD